MPLSPSPLYDKPQKNNKSLYWYVSEHNFKLLLSMFCIGIINYITATILSQVIYFENLSSYQKSWYRTCSQRPKWPVCIPNCEKQKNKKNIVCTLSSRCFKNTCYLSWDFYEVQKKYHPHISGYHPAHARQEADFKPR